MFLVGLTLLDFDDSLKDDFDDTSRGKDLDEPDDGYLDDIDDSDVEEHDNSSEEDLETCDGDIPPLLALEHSRALLAEGDDGLKVGPDLLPGLVLVREHDGRHAVGLVTLALTSAG